MRVLLYETGENGHRGVYLHYYETALGSAGLDVLVHSEPPFTGLFGFNAHVQQLAKKAECDLVHVLTVDDHTKRIFFSAPCRPSAKRIPIVGTYYLFANLRGWLKISGFRWCWLRGNLAAIVVPQAASLACPDIQSHSGIPIYLLPDPVPTSGDNPPGKKAAIEALGLPSDWCGKTIVLVFGVLNKRRGVDLLANTARALAKTRNNLKFVFAGRLDSASLPSETISILRTLDRNGDAMLIDRWLPDAEVDTLYAAADVFCIHPEHGFAGVNSTAMRALDCGLTVAAPKDSITACCALACHQGAAFERNSVESLKRVLLNWDRNSLVQSRTRAGRRRHRLTASIETFGNELVSLYRKIGTSKPSS